MKHNFEDADFKTPQMCGGQWGCVGVAINSDRVAIRNTTDKNKTTVVFDHAEWRDFLNAVADGKFTTS